MRSLQPSASPRTADPQTSVPGRRDARRQDASADAQRRVLYRIDWDGLRHAGRACCCPAQPVVMVIIPPAAGREHRTDLLLCMHHFRVSRAVLTAAGALVLGPDRELIPPDALAYLPATER